METFKFIKGKYTNEKVVADSSVIKAVLSNGTDVTKSVNNKAFQTAALAGDNVSDKEVKVYTLKESLGNINPIGEVDGNAVKITSLGVTESPSGNELPAGAATELSKTQASADLTEEINWNISSGKATTKVNVKVGEATVPKTAKFTISGTVTVKKFVKAEGNLTNTPVFTKENLKTNGSNGTGYYNDGRKCVAIEKYTTKNKVEKTPSTLNGGPYHNLVVNPETNWMLGINRSETTISNIDNLIRSFNINNVSFDTNTSVKVSAWQKTTDTSYKKMSEVTVVCDLNVYYQGYRLPTESCFDNNGNELNKESALTNIDTVYKEKCNVVSGGIPYKYDSEDTDTYYTYASEECVQSSSDNCNISNNTLTPNQKPFNKKGDENSIYLNEKVENVQKKVEFQ